jgi:prepilin peptidase CpaA
MMYQWSYHSIILYLATVIICGISIVTDIKTRKILNVVTYPAIVFGFLAGPTLVILYGGTFWEGLTHSLWGFLLGFGFFFVFYLIGKGKNMGAGDVKLMGAIGALLGWKMTVNAIIITALVGLLVAVLLFFPLFYALIKTGNASTLKGYGKMTMPYGVSIAIGTVLAVLLRILYVTQILEAPIFL